MKYLSTLLLAVLFVAPALADAAPPETARQRWLHGNYEVARDLYQELAKEAKYKDIAAIGLSRVHESEGHYDQALAVIDAALQASPKNADLHARKAELLFTRGRWDGAEKAASQALKLQKESFPAHWVRVQLYRDRGQLKKADAECRWFVRTYTQRSDNDTDIKNPEELLLVGLAGCENARWNNLSDQFSFILNEVYGDALKYDKDFWPAHNERGMLLLEKYNRGEALDEFDKALAINPKAAEALVGKGLAALQKLEIRSAEQFAERALKINPNLSDALTLRADVWLATGNVKRALEELDQARKTNPRAEQTLARIAACYFLQRQTADFTKLVAEVEKHDTAPGLFYDKLAEQLEERRRFDDAEKFYKRAIQLRPKLPWPEDSLGLLYMRLGREKEARDVLSKAFEADSFNVRVANSLKVLRHLEKYETLKTPHFVLRFDSHHDRELAKYMAPYLEGIYTNLTEKFHFKPKEPYLVEVINNHEMFSGRTIALPDLHTIGACTGRMFAMVSPRGKGIPRPFNWARVLRHEMVHLFNLEQTHFLVPHWFTEGLAVSNEGFPRPQPWNELLLEHVPTGKLMNLDNIDLGFIRPRRPEEWHLAYCQSQLYIQYLTEKYGTRTIGDMLDAYRDGLDTAAAIARVCKVNKETFEQGYRAYLEGVVKTIKKRPAAKPMKFAKLKEAHENDPHNADIAARLALQYLVRGQRRQARKLADEVLVKVAKQPLASYVKARLLQAAGDDDAARKVLEAAVDRQAPEPRVVEALGKLYLEARDFAKAADMYELARQAEPYESKWLKELVHVYALSGDKDKQIQTLKDLVPTDADDLASRKRLAQLLVASKRYAEAETYARQALEIDVLDADAQKALAEALLGQGKRKAAIEAFKAVLASNDNADDARIKLAQAYLESGNKQQAANELATVRDKDSPEARRLQMLLDGK